MLRNAQTFKFALNLHPSRYMKTLEAPFVTCLDAVEKNQTPGCLSYDLHLKSEYKK